MIEPEEDIECVSNSRRLSRQWICVVGDASAVRLRDFPLSTSVRHISW